jgi:anti-sigma B factor antagonist
MPEDNFPVEVAGGVPVVAAPEEIDITNAEALRSALLTAADGHGTLVVDMTRTRFCDSSGLHTLIAVHKRAGAEGREVLLVIPGAAVLRVLALTGMDQVIPSFTTLAGALTLAAATADGHGRQRDDGDAAPETSRGPGPAGDLPGTPGRSPQEARQRFTRALTRAAQVHGDGDQAFRAAYAELKHTVEKRGDHRIPEAGLLARGQRPRSADSAARDGDQPGLTALPEPGLTMSPADHGIHARVARRAPGGPPRQSPARRRASGAAQRSRLDHQQVGGSLRLGVHAEDLCPRERGRPATRPGRTRQDSQDRLGL